MEQQLLTLPELGRRTSDHCRHPRIGVNRPDPGGCVERLPAGTARDIAADVVFVNLPAGESVSGHSQGCRAGERATYSRTMGSCRAPVADRYVQGHANSWRLKYLLMLLCSVAYGAHRSCAR